MIELMNYSNQEKVQQVIKELESKKRKDRSDSDKVRLLQLKLYDKAKREKAYCFYILYDKIFQGHVLRQAYKKVKANGGGPGVDGITFETIEENGLTKYLESLGEELRKRTYRPQAVKRVWIEKPGGGRRPLGIPTIRDRIAQTACKLVLEPIYEADFCEESYGYRPKRSAQEAIRRIKTHLQKGRTQIYDADLSQFFDSIPHDKLEVALRERVSDTRVLELIKLWLKAPVVGDDGQYTSGKKRKKGTPQGGVISPLLANIYLNLLDRIVTNPAGVYGQLGIKLVRYADDFVLMAKELKAEAIAGIENLLGRMGLQINGEKTKLIEAKEEPFDFLGFTMRYDRSIFGKGRFWHVRPSKKSCKKLRRNINEELKKIGHYTPQGVSDILNPILRGWINYFSIQGVSYMQVPLKELEGYLRDRLYRYYQRKSQRGSNLHGQQAYEMLVKEYGLMNVFAFSQWRPVKAQSRKP